MEVEMAAPSASSASRIAPIYITLKPALDQLQHDFGLSSGELAQTIAVDRRTLERWASGDTFPRHAARDRLLALVALHGRLAELFETAEDLRTWLHRPLPFLGNMAPIDAVKVGRIESVDAALEAIDEGFVS
jgi:putative toxin-antitoxin system antitoxin component (TIGR02293 family)